MLFRNTLPNKLTAFLTPASYIFQTSPCPSSINRHEVFVLFLLPYDNYKNNNAYQNPLGILKILDSIFFCCSTYCSNDALTRVIMYRYHGSILQCSFTAVSNPKCFKVCLLNPLPLKYSEGIDKSHSNSIETGLCSFFLIKYLNYCI